MKKVRILLVLIAIASLITGIAVFLLTGGMQHDVSTLVALGEKYLEEGDYEEAALQFERAIAISEKSPEAWYGSARANIGLGNDDEAIKALKTVAELDPSQKDKVDWMIEKIKAGEGEGLILLPYDTKVTSDEEYQALFETETESVGLPTEDETSTGFGQLDQSVKDAYLNLIETARQEEGEDIRYNLIYFNDDRVPDLVIDRPGGYGIFLYVYENGEIHCPVDGWQWGAFGNVGYEYIERKSAITNLNNDFAGAINWYSIMIMDENYEMREAYAEECYNFDDVNGNGMPDDEELTEEAIDKATGKVEYFCNTGENLSQDEISKRMDALIAFGEKSLMGELTYEEILQLL